MHPKLDVKHHLTFWSHTKMDINKKLVHWAGTNKWKFTICETTGSKFNDFHHCGHESNIKKYLGSMRASSYVYLYTRYWWYLHISLHECKYCTKLHTWAMMIFNGFLDFLPPELALFNLHILGLFSKEVKIMVNCYVEISFSLCLFWNSGFVS